MAFTDTSTGGPTSWTWSFGDGSTATIQHPTHTYASARAYTVTLTVKKADGTRKVVRRQYIKVQANKVRQK